ncbi:MAG: hypothetical protein K1060chlam1_00621 [Candidatus Anoxychlamydiales bacterium]|nr:hypothetical protein [Candidatus Anoxychlamydiales bacterium]
MQNIKLEILSLKIILLFVFIFTQAICYTSENSQNDKLRILVGCPVYQKPAILKECLESLKGLEKKSFTLDYFFIDNNNLEESSQLLKDFSQELSQKSNVLILSMKNDSNYICDENKHHWNEQAIWRVAKFKDLIIQKAITESYDYLFLIDSDVAVHPKTINQLLESKKDIISNIYWTKWDLNSDFLPQVWLMDNYKLFKIEASEYATEEDIKKRTDDFLTMLKKPGLYEVGGLGGCILISKKALKKGVCFERINNVTIFKEDYHFCLKAVVLGLSLFVDTHYPAFHIYRESDLTRLQDFKKECGIKTPRITLSMVIRNEANRYLRKVLQNAKEYITDAVIIDDASSDDSAKICLEVLKGIPLQLIVNTKSKFANEIDLRKQQWEETIKTNPEWILNLDADEVFEDKFKDQVKYLINSKDTDLYSFRLYDFWNETHYRDDQYWQGHNNYFPLLIKYNPKTKYYFKKKAQHCGRFPNKTFQIKETRSKLRVKHFGWSKLKDRIAKNQRYKQLDPDAKYGIKKHYESILDDNPTLTKWED